MVARVWARGERLPHPAQVAAIALLGVAVGAMGLLRAAHDPLMAAALVAMGAVALVHAGTRAVRAVLDRSAR